MSDNSVQSLERAFGLLDTLSLYPNGMHLMEIASETGLNKSTAHRLLASLIALGYVKKAEGASGKYQLSLKLFELAGRVVESINVLDVARGALEKLCDAAKETIHLVVRDGCDIVYIHKSECPSNAYRLFSQIGMRRPLYCTAAGKSILATLSDREVAAIWEQSKIETYTEHTITSLTELYRALDGIRASGYALDNEENEPGVRCLAAAIRDYTGGSRAAFSISAPSLRLSEERILELVPEVRATAERLSKEMGYIVRTKNDTSQSLNNPT